MTTIPPPNTKMVDEAKHHPTVPWYNWLKDINSSSSTTPQPYILVDDYGAVGDGSTDDATAFTDALAVWGTAGGVVYVHPSKRYYIGANITIPQNITLKGAFSIVGIPSNAGAVDLWDYGSCLLVSSSKTITMSGGSCLDGLLIMRSTMTGPENDPSAYAGTAITVAGDDTLIENCMIIGFNQAYSSNNSNRTRINRVNTDCVNGILINNSFDVGYIREVHCWPFGTIAATSPTTTFGTGHFLFRNGTAFSFTNTVDFTQISNCFAFGYNRAFTVDGPQNLTFVECCADNISQVSTPNTIPGSIGFLVQGASNYTNLTACQVWECNHGYYLNMAGSTQEALINGCRATAVSDGGMGVAAVLGSANIIGCRLHGSAGSGYGIYNASTANSIVAVGNRITASWTANTNGTIVVDLGNV